MSARSFLCALAILVGLFLPPASQAGETPDGQFATGAFHACRVLADKSISCWGSNQNGALNVPPGQYKAVSAGFDFSCGVRTDGTLACWGYNEWGSTTLPNSSQGFRFISSGGFHSCAMSEDTFPRTVCWGDNRFGQLEPGIVDTYAHVSVHNFTSCGVRLAATIPGNDPVYEGPINCWGDLAEHVTDIGQVLEYPTERWFLQVATGFRFVCGIWYEEVEAFTNLGCWGRNLYGLTSDEPVGHFKQVSAGDFFACALRKDGSIACWGDNFYGQLNSPAGNNWVAISVGREYACAIRNDGVPQCWGRNERGAAPSPTLIPASLPSGKAGILYGAGFSMYDGTSTGSGTGYSAGGQVFSISSGTLPPGLSIYNDATGLAGGLVGTPKFGTYTFTVRAQDKNGFVAFRTYTLNIEGSTPGGPFPPDVIRDILVLIRAQNLPTNIAQTLSNPLEGALRIVADSKTRNDPRACTRLENFIEKVEKKETRAKISAALATELHLQGDQAGVLLGCW